MDLVFIDDLNLMAKVGITEAERVKKRCLAVSITVQADLSTAATSDSIENTVNYVSIKKEAERLAENLEFCLLERFGGLLADWIIENCRAALTATVTVRKVGLWPTGVPGIRISKFRPWKQAS